MRKSYVFGAAMASAFLCLSPSPILAASQSSHADHSGHGAGADHKHAPSMPADIRDPRKNEPAGNEAKADHDHDEKDHEEPGDVVHRAGAAAPTRAGRAR